MDTDGWTTDFARYRAVPELHTGHLINTEVWSDFPGTLAMSQKFGLFLIRPVCFIQLYSDCNDQCVKLMNREIDALHCSQPAPITNCRNTNSEYTDQKWSKMAQNGPKWPKILKKFPKLGQNGHFKVHK